MLPILIAVTIVGLAKGQGDLTLDTFAIAEVIANNMDKCELLYFCSL